MHSHGVAEGCSFSGDFGFRAWSVAAVGNHQMMSKACSMWQRSCIHSFICSIDVVCGAGANDLLSLVQLYTVRRIQTQELESAIAVAVADVKTEPGTESQVAQVQLTPVPGLGLYTCMTA